MKEAGKKEIENALDEFYYSFDETDTHFELEFDKLKKKLV